MGHRVKSRGLWTPLTELIKPLTNKRDSSDELGFPFSESLGFERSKDLEVAMEHGIAADDRVTAGVPDEGWWKSGRQRTLRRD